DQNRCDAVQHGADHRLLHRPTRGRLNSDDVPSMPHNAQAYLKCLLDARTKDNIGTVGRGDETMRLTNRSQVPQTVARLLDHLVTIDDTTVVAAEQRLD